ncbi:MAG: type II toxin-antitoxin system death-on-curing family toxin [Tepidimonas sp.]
MEEARAAIARLKGELMARGEASDLFGRERGETFAAILGNLKQTVFVEPAYPTVQTKAAHLLYFAIKNHPFADGNKRTGAFLFVDFLARNGRLVRDGEPVINDVGLAALALLVAESDARNKDVMVRLIENMLALPAPPGQPPQAAQRA